jgi:hypothetical protein
MISTKLKERETMSDSVSKSFIKSVEHLINLHQCEQEGIESGMPEAEDWTKAVDEVSRKLSIIKQLPTVDDKPSEDEDLTLSFRSGYKKLKESTEGLKPYINDTRQGQSERNFKQEVKEIDTLQIYKDTLERAVNDIKEYCDKIRELKSEIEKKDDRIMELGNIVKQLNESNIKGLDRIIKLENLLKN